MAEQDVIQGYADGLFRVLQAEGELDRVEDELYRFSKALEANNELKQALSNEALERADRVRIIEELLADEFSSHTIGLLTFIVTQERSRQMSQILDQLSVLAAEARRRVLAEVRSAVPLNDDQRRQLADALGKATGKEVELKVLIDPSVIGGVHAKVGDTVIDGTIKRRLEQLKAQVRG